MYKILTESAGFCKRCDKKILVCYFDSQFQLPFNYQTPKLSFTRSLETLFRWDGKRLHYCMLKALSTTRTKVYRNRPGFVEDMTKTWCVFRFAV